MLSQNASDLADRVETEAEPLVHRWTELLRGGVAPSHSPEAELRDHVPYVLLELIVALRAGRVAPRSEAAQEHGEQRYRLGFSVKAVTREYSLLRDLVLELAERHAPAVPFATVRLVCEFFDNAVGESVTEYTRREAQRRDEVEQVHLLALHEHQDHLRGVIEAARHRIERIVRNAPAFVATLRGPTHEFDMVNEPYQRLVGVGRELVGLTVAEALPEVVPQGFVALLDRVYDSGTPFLGDETVVRLDRDGDGASQDTYVNFLYQPTRNVEGKVDGIDVFGFDVTEQVSARRRVEALANEARASEALLQLVTDALPVLVSFVTADERYAMVNKAYEDWFGLERGQLLGRTILEVVGEAAYAVLGPHVRRGLAGESFVFEQRGVPYRHGGARDVKVSFVANRSPEGAPDGYVALLQDVTAQHQLERELERLASQRLEMLESMGDAFFAVDAEWRFVLVNANQERLARTSREAMLGRVLWEVFPEVAGPESVFGEAYRRAMRERAVVELTDYYAPLDIWTSVHVHPTSDGGIAVFVRDVSSEKAAQRALLQQSEFEQQLLGIVSHDLRNPLHVIQLGASVLGQTAELDASGRKIVDRIQSAVSRATRLVDDLLDFTQARLGGGIHIDPRPADLHVVTQAMVDEVAAAHPARTIELRHEGDGAGRWDPDRLSQVVQNLVTNALKYSPAGSSVRVLTCGDPEGATLSVHNSGPPIPPSQRERLFQPMQRGVGQIDKTGRSVGLGLYIVRSIVEAHRGRVEVRSAEGEGTTFTVWLPAEG